MLKFWCFKPYYNWNTFNTLNSLSMAVDTLHVLNLIITGIPSIHTANYYFQQLKREF